MSLCGARVRFPFTTSSTAALFIVLALCTLAALAPLKAGAAATISYLTTDNGGDENNQSYSFPGLTLGTAAADSIIFVTIFSEDANATDPKTVTIAGVSATEVISSVDAGNGVMTSPVRRVSPALTWPPSYLSRRWLPSHRLFTSN